MGEPDNYTEDDAFIFDLQKRIEQLESNAMGQLFETMAKIREGVNGDCEITIKVTSTGESEISVAWENRFTLTRNFTEIWRAGDKMTVKFYVDWINRLMS